MARVKTSVLAIVLLAFVAGSPLSGAVVGSIAGFVRDDRGMPQMGAAVTLLSADGRALRRVYTNSRGSFEIHDLFPGLYGVRVSFPSFLPALKEKIQIEPGVRSYLEVHLANLLTSIQLVYPRSGEFRDMSEDWKWVLRTATATRPVLRLTPWEDQETQAVLRKFSGAFGELQGMVKVSAGDGARISGYGSESDLGTAFAVATSLFGNSNILLSGNVGYDGTRGTPSAGFHTTYSREMPYGAQPEVSLTVRQLFRPALAGQALFGPANGNGAVLQTFTLGFQDRVVLGDLINLEYGFQYDSISFLDRLNYASPFGRLSYRLGDKSHLILRYASGVPRLDNTVTGEGALGRNLMALGLYPRLSLLGGHTALQRGEHMEVAVQKETGDGVFELAAYRDDFSNTALTAIVPAGLYSTGDLLPDLFSNTSTFNAGSYQVSGYRASYTHKWSEHVRLGLVYGLNGVLLPQRDSLVTNNPNELRSILKPGQEHSVTARLIAQLPQARTWVSSSYRWASQTPVTAADLFNVSETRALPGVNVTVRQPLPQVNYLPGKFEATAEFRNLLAQGYVPLQTADGRRLLLIQSFRSFRGGVSFVF